MPLPSLQPSLITGKVGWLPEGSVSEFPGFPVNVCPNGIVVCADGAIIHGTHASLPGFSLSPTATATCQQFEDSGMDSRSVCDVSK